VVLIPLESTSPDASNKMAAAAAVPALNIQMIDPVKHDV